MKNTIYIPFVVLFSLALSSYKLVDNTNDLLIGTWTHLEYENGIIKYVKAKRLKKNTPGIEFRENDMFVERKNVNWCGTEPYTPYYDDCNGLWEMASDSILTIKYDNCGRVNGKQNWRIIKLNSRSLEIRRTD